MLYALFLLSCYRTYDEVHSVSKDALAYLVHNEFIEWSKAEQKYRPTKLASATVASALAPEEGLVCFYLFFFVCVGHFL